MNWYDSCLPDNYYDLYNPKEEDQMSADFWKIRACDAESKKSKWTVACENYEVRMLFFTITLFNCFNSASGFLSELYCASLGKACTFVSTEMSAILHAVVDSRYKSAYVGLPIDNRWLHSC